MKKKTYEQMQIDELNHKITELKAELLTLKANYGAEIAKIKAEAELRIQERITDFLMKQYESQGSPFWNEKK